MTQPRSTAVAFSGHFGGACLLAQSGPCHSGDLGLYANCNNFMGPLIYLNTMEKYTLPIGLTFFVNVRGTTYWNLLMAASVMVLIPCLILFFIGQRYFVQGIALTGIKG
jgi:multiple sugar transport system permease protein